MEEAGKGLNYLYSINVICGEKTLIPAKHTVNNNNSSGGGNKSFANAPIVCHCSVRVITGL
jgi:hypothetical protein